MQDDIDETVKASKVAIERTEALIRDARAALESGGPAGRDAPGIVAAWIAKQPPEMQAEVSKAREEILAEIERDLPRQHAAKPSSAGRRPRQMV